jgi:hypothetical protein
MLRILFLIPQIKDDGQKESSAIQQDKRPHHPALLLPLKRT